MSEELEVTLPKRTPAWIALGDNVAMGLCALVLFLGIWNWGLAEIDGTRAIGWTFCAALGAWGFVGVALGRLDGPENRALRAFLYLMGGFVVVAGLFNIPMDVAQARSHSPALAESLDSLAAAGLAVPERVTLALSPGKAANTWTQAIAIFLFAVGLAPLATRRTGTRFLVAVAIFLCLLEGALGVIVFVFRGVGRAYGAIYNPNHHAALALMGIPPALALLYLLPHYRRRFRGDIGGGRNPLLPLYALILVGATGWLASISRSSVAVGAAVLAVWGAWEYQRIRARRLADGGGEENTGHRTQRLLVVGVVAVSIAVVAVLFGSEVAGRTGSIGSVRQIDRIENVRATIEGLKSTNWMGTGLGATEYTLNRYADYSTSSAAIHTHNDFVETLGELGAYGFGILAALALWLAFATWRIRRAALKERSVNQLMLTRAILAGLATVVIHASTDFSLRIPLIMMVAVMFACAALGPAGVRMFGERTGG